MTIPGHPDSVKRKAKFGGRFRDFESGLTVTDGHTVCDLVYLCVRFSLGSFIPRLHIEGQDILFKHTFRIFFVLMLSSGLWATGPLSKKQIIL